MAGMQPWLIKAKARQCLPIEPAGARFPLGASKQSVYESCDLEMEKGDTLIFYTDGIPEATDENDEFISPYEPGDSVYVEIHSITYDAFIFLNELRSQIDRPGGFAELFAVPLSNIPTNIINTNTEGEEALGFFCISAVSSGGSYLDPDNLPQLANN